MPESMSDAEVDRFLAEKVCGWTYSSQMQTWCVNGNDPVKMAVDFRPSSDRHALAEVLEKLTSDQWNKLYWPLRKLHESSKVDAWFQFLLTASPSIVARAILAAYQEQRTGGPR